MADLLTPDQTADYLLAESRERGEILTNLKLQKLIFYSQAWHLALNGTPLFSEDFQAWVHGPVLPTQYRRFRDFRWKPIMAEIDNPNPGTTVREHLDEVLDVFGPETAVALEIMTHRERPWLDARGNLDPTEASEAIIPKEAMQQFYRELASA